MKEYKLCVFAQFADHRDALCLRGYDEEDRWLGDNDKDDVYLTTLSIDVDEEQARKDFAPKKVAGLEKEIEELGKEYRANVLAAKAEISSLMAIENKSGE